MSIDSVFKAWRRLNESSLQWQQLLHRAGLFLSTSDKAEFAKALGEPIHINREVAGFEDFDPTGRRGLEPGDPARGLLYHAFASPNVTTLDDKTLKAFPALDEIIELENLVYSKAKLSYEALLEQACQLSQCDSPEIAVTVFAYEYQPASRTVHRKHADLCFSRTGIARAGTHDAYYSPIDRGWLTFNDKDSSYTIRVIPARYGAFLSVRLNGSHDTFGPKYFFEPRLTEPGDANRHFWVPFHKLFSGNDCIPGCNLNIQFHAEHINEKLRRIHLELAKRKIKTRWTGTVLDSYPFKFDADIAIRQPHYGSALIIPYTQPLVRQAALQHPTILEDGTRLSAGSLVTFTVPRDPSLFFTTFRIRPNDNKHYPCSKYVNCRTEVTNGVPQNLNNDPNLLSRVHQGGYEALHYVDFTGDGVVSVTCEGLPEELPRAPAYSIVAQPDFLPFVAQSDVFDWWREICPEELKPYVWGDGPDPTPLSYSRMSANFSSHHRLDAKDDTISAIISAPRSHHGHIHKIDPYLDGPLANSCLPDDGSGDFAPGWDIAISMTDRLEHLSNYGMSSPFPEDARLCAAFGATCAAVPDITNWFPADGYTVVVPLGNAAAGWDQTVLPFPLFKSEKVWDYPATDYSDWVQTAIFGQLDLVRLKDVTLKTYLSRLLTMARTFKIIGAKTDDDRTHFSVAYFSRLSKDHNQLNTLIDKTNAIRLKPEEAYEIHLFEETDRSTNHRDFQRAIIKTGKTTVVFAGPDSVLIQDAQGNWAEKW